MELWAGAFNLGIIYGFLAMGIFITSRILDFPDITVDGSFTTGAATGAILLVNGIHPLLAIIAAFGAGMVCGSFTGLIHTKLKIDSLLAGILVMTALYSINLHIMGRSNISLLKGTTIFSLFNAWNPGMHSEIWTMIILSSIMLIFWGLVAIFFKTDLGITIRSTGDNAVMTEAGGVNVARYKVFSIALANGFVALAGCFVAQYQGFADIGMGIGSLVIGLASVIMGEAVIKSRSITWKLLAVVLGAIIYRYMIALALFAGMNPIDLKLITALFVLLTLVISYFSKNKPSLSLAKIRPLLIVAVVILLGLWAGNKIFSKKTVTNPENIKQYKIGIVQISQNGILNITRDAFLQEMKRIGFDDNTEFLVKSADSDLATLNTILDNFLAKNVDLVLTISTPATQAAINKIKNTPVVFATVANPFVFGAGDDEKHHLPNVTGTYGWVPMDKLVSLSQEIFPLRTVVGTMGNRGEANTEFYLDILRNTVNESPGLKLEERAITSPNDVYEAALSIVSKGAQVFILPVDNVIYSSFDAILKVAAQKKVPIFSSDVKRLADGAFISYGYDYASSGIQAAHLVERVLNGEDPNSIPFERYKKMIFGLNLQIADKYGIDIPQNYIDKANIIIQKDGTEISKTPKIGLLKFSADPISNLVKRGVYDALASKGFINGINLEIEERSANADFQMINTINQSFIAGNIDIIIPLCTSALQSAIKLTESCLKPEIVFSFVSDPFAAGAGKSANDHLSNVTGYSCFPPLNKMLDIIEKVFPDKKTVGIVWNSSEMNSQVIVRKLEKLLPARHLKLKSVTISGSAEVLEASRSLAAQGADVFLNIGDNTLSESFDSFLKVAQENNIPVISDNIEHAKAGAVLCVGIDFYSNGYEAGLYAARIIGGEKAGDLPILPAQAVNIIVNQAVANQNGWLIPSELLQAAALINQIK